MMRLVLLTFLLVFNLQASSLFTNKEQLNTSKYIDSLKNLILATEKTRGLTNSYLNGNSAAMLLVFASRGDMKSAIGNMESLPLASDPVINSSATAISHAVINLNHKAFKEAPKKVFSAYTVQIEQMLMLAQSVSKRFAKDLTPFGKNISSTMMEIMLPMTEYTGKLRGEGAGIAAKGKATRAQVESIQALLYELQSANTKLQNSMATIMSTYSGKLSQTTKMKLAFIKKEIQNYIMLVQTKLLKNPQSVDANKYFDKGTNIITDVVSVYNMSNEAIAKDAKGWF